LNQTVVEKLNEPLSLKSVGWEFQCQFFKPLPPLIKFILLLNGTTYLLAVFIDIDIRKNLFKNLLTMVSQEVMDLGRMEFNQAFALSFKEKGNSQRYIDSSEKF
jgi:hypothetical protein